MRMRNPFVLWLLGASLALPALTTAQVVQAVSVSQEQGQTLLTVTGERLPRPSVRVWRRQFLVLEFSARFSGRGREVSQNTPHLTKLRYGWFSSRPPKVRVVATLRGSPALHAGADPHRLASPHRQGDGATGGSTGAVRLQACRRRAEGDHRRQRASDAPRAPTRPNPTPSARARPSPTPQSRRALPRRREFSSRSTS
jgi:hypothetical protein